MPADHDPTSSRIDQVLVVELEGLDGRASTGGHSDDVRAIMAPGKMLTPGLLAGVEEGDALAGDRVYPVRLRGFVTVA